MVGSQQKRNLLKKTFINENLKRYYINVLELGPFYNFYNSREAVSEFLTVFENNFIPNADIMQFRFKFSFTIVNQQPALKDGFAEITDGRIWKTNVYDGVYFNDFIKSNLADNILKRVIMSGMSGSSWRFKRFDRICITVNSDDLRSVGKKKYFDAIEFIGKYTRVEGPDHEMEDDASGDEVNETNFQDQEPTNYRLMNVTRDLIEAVTNQSVAQELDLVS